MTEDDFKCLERKLPQLEGIGDVDWTQEVKNLCSEIRRLEKFSNDLSLMLQSESRDRQMYAFNSDYWEEHCRIYDQRRRI